METLGIDPGANLGWAVLNEKGILRACGLHNPPTGPGYDVVIERPQVYPSTSAKQANDLITLAIGLGRVSAHYPEGAVTLVLPHAWKGTTPKEIHNRRVLRALAPCESLTYCADIVLIPEGKRNNVIDAIGLAKWLFSRSSGRATV